MSNVSQWSTNPANNNSTPPDGYPEGMAPSSVNDSARETLAAVAKWYSDTDGTLTSTGSANAYVLTTNSAHAALADQSTLVFKANFANTGAATLAVDGLVAKPMKKKHDVDLASGDIEANQIVVVVYNATDDVYEVISQVADILPPAKAWIYFNGTGTVSDLAFFNCDATTDNGTGDYTVNWTTDFLNANYCVVIHTNLGTSTGSFAQHGHKPQIRALAAGSVNIRTPNANDNPSSTFSLTDSAVCMVAAFGTQ